MTKAELLDILEDAHDDTLILLRDSKDVIRYFDAAHRANVPVDGKVCAVLVLTEGPQV